MCANKRKQLNNDGITLIEIIIVIAIMTILVGVGITGLTLLGSGNSKKTAHGVEEMLQTLRTSTMTQDGTWTGVLMNDGGEYKLYINNGTSNTYVNNLGSRATLKYGDKDATELTELPTGQSLVFKFNRRTGKCSDVRIRGNNGSDGDGTTIKADSDVALVVEASNGNRKSQLTLYYETGKITIP